MEIFPIVEFDNIIKAILNSRSREGASIKEIRGNYIEKIFY